VFVADYTDGTIQEYSAIGASLGEWKPRSLGGGFLAEMYMEFANGELVIATAAPPPSRIVVYNAERNPVREWQELSARTSWVASSDEMAVDALGSVYTVVGDPQMVVKYKSNGAFERQWSALGPYSGRNPIVGGIAVGPNNVVYVSLLDQDVILKFSAPSGLYIGAFGEFGNGPGQFYWPNGLDIDEDGVLYVAEINNLRVQKLALDGGYLGEFVSGAMGSRPLLVDAHRDGVHVLHEDNVVRYYEYQADAPAQTPAER
jgi:hypothetical protein